MAITTRFGEAWAVIPMSLAASVAPRLRPLALQAFTLIVVSHLFVQAFKRTLRRERPRLERGIRYLTRIPDRFSLPSGHAAAALSFVLPFASAASTLVGAVLLFFGVLVGLSRPYLGVHYPGDVVAGWAIAIGTYFAAPLIVPGLS